jgi:hypothetical protein
MFFKKGLRGPSLIRKLAMKTPKMSEAMFTITNKFALAEEVTLNTREQKKEKESGHTDQPSSSKGHDKKRKADHSVNAVERPQHNKEYKPRPGEFEGFLDHICIFHPQGKHKTRDCDRLQGFTYEVLKMAKSIRRKSLKNPRVTSLKLIRRSTTSMVALIRLSQGGSKNS